MALAFPARSRPRSRSALGVLLLGIGLIVTSPPVASQSDGEDGDDDAGPVASFLAELLGPDESFPPVEIELTGSLPRSATFQGVELIVDRVHLTNTHPYWMFGEPEPGELFYVVVEVTARNGNDDAYDYGLGDEAFDLRTWSGRLLPHVPAPGASALGRLEAGEVKSDELVFGSETPDVLDGAALLVGRPPDTPLVIPLTAPPLSPDYPLPVSPLTLGPYQAGPIAWSVLQGEASLDRPANVCCPETGSRADEGELYLTLVLSGLVKGSQYGQTTVSTDAVRLVVDGQPQAPFEFDGRANTPEGEAYEFAASWLAHEGDPHLALQFLDGADVVANVPIVVGASAPAIEAALEATAGPGATAAPGATGQPSPSPSDASTTPVPPASVAPVPTPRPVTAALATLLIYSGVPDPYWSLTADDLGRLDALAAELVTQDGVPPEDGLGYRGFRVTGPGGTWRANGGVVVTPASPPGMSLADPERTIERFLLERGLATLSDEEAAVVDEALATPADVLQSPTPSAGQS